MLQNIKKCLSLFTVLAVIAGGMVFFPSAAAADESSGLVAQYNFEGDFRDTSGYGNDGSLIGRSGSITFVNGIFGKAAHFDGNSYLEVKDSPSLHLSTAFTLSVWAYKEVPVNDNNPGVPYIEKNGEYGNYPYYLRDWFNLTPQTGICDTDEVVEDASSDAPFDLQKWSLITSTFDGTYLKIYINDKLVKSQSLQFAGSTLMSSNDSLFIGFGNFMNADNYFKGTMDDVRIYNKALSFQDIEKMYNAGLNGPSKALLARPDKLVAYYSFDGNLNDASGFNNNGKAAGGSIKYKDAVAGQAAIFTGSNYIEVQDSDSLDLDKAFTVGVWLYKEKSDDHFPILYKDGSSLKDPAFSYYITDFNDSFGPRIKIPDLNKQEYLDYFFNAKTPINAGKWSYYTVTFDGHNVKSYIDGKLSGVEQLEDELAHSTKALLIGSDGTDFFNGMMDELRIYNYALNANQINEQLKRRDTITASVTVKQLSALKANKTIAAKFTKKLINKNTLIDITKTASYATSNKYVATVSSGVIKPVGKGKANITVTSGANSLTVPVVVK